MSLTNVKSSLESITKSLSKSNESREYLIKNTREVIILCSQSIIASHIGDLTIAKNKAQKAKKLFVLYKKKANTELERYLITPGQELVEAYAVLAIINKEKIPSAKSLQVSGASYILGLLDCIGELKRLVYDKIRIGNDSEASRIFDVMEKLYLELGPFSMYDKLIKEARRKLDVGRILVEDTRGALTEEIRRNELIKSINNAKK